MLRRILFAGIIGATAFSSTSFAIGPMPQIVETQPEPKRERFPLVRPRNPDDTKVPNAELSIPVSITVTHVIDPAMIASINSSSSNTTNSLYVMAIAILSVGIGLILNGIAALKPKG